MKTGIVLDILRCSLHDGPGIRTTVFLKGCPLSCLWCHNPESQSRNPVLSFNPRKCVHCEACAQVCPGGVHDVTAEAHVLHRDGCTACGLCVEACPAQALEIKGKRMTVTEVIAEVEKDADYYLAFGGGLTLSGGEPMAQAAFAESIASESKRRGIHVAMETSGMAPEESYHCIQPSIDLFLFDYKGTNARQHAAHTGVSNEPILKNLDMLYRAGARILLRCPLIPGVNDGDEYLQGIAALERRYPELVGIKLMPYHNMGNEKARRAGVPVRLDQPDSNAETKRRWLARLAKIGCHAVIDT